MMIVWIYDEMGIEDKILHKIAKLYYVDTINIGQIAKTFKISIATVSRCLKKARENKIVEFKINPYKETYDDLEYRIEDLFEIKEVFVVPTNSGQEKMYSEAGIILGDIFKRILKPGDYIGVSWGETDKKVFDSLVVEKKFNVNVVPILGGMGEKESGVFTNAISKILADKFGGISYLINSPAILDSERARVIIENDSNTKRVMELWKKITVAVIGVGDLSKESSVFKYSIFTEQELSYLKKLRIAGEVNLNYLDEDGSAVANEIDGRLIRMSLDQIRRIDNVIIVAFGSRKVKGIKAVLKGKIADILITDFDTARSIVGS